MHTGKHGGAGTTIASGVSPLIISKLSWQAVFYIFGASATLWLPFWFLTKIPKQKLDSTDEQPSVETSSQAQVISVESDTAKSSLGSVDAASTEVEQLLDRPRAALASESVAVSDTPKFAQMLGNVGMDAGFIGLTQRKEVWAICAAQYCNSWGAYALLNWLPTYFSEQVRAHLFVSFLV